MKKALQGHGIWLYLAIRNVILDCFNSRSSNCLKTDYPKDKHNYRPNLAPLPVWREIGKKNQSQCLQLKCRKSIRTKLVWVCPGIPQSSTVKLYFSLCTDLCIKAALPEPWTVIPWVWRMCLCGGVCSGCSLHPPFPLTLLQRSAAEAPLLHSLVFRLCFHLLCFRE